MKRLLLHINILLLIILSLSSCKKWMDVNSDSDTPQNPNPASVFPTQLAAVTRAIQWDSRFLGKYTQNWLTSASGRPATELTWDKHGFNDASDNAGDIWRQTYFGLGKNLNYIIDQGTIKGQWDYVGAAYALKAYMFQLCTDYHGELIFSQVFEEGRAIFDYDDQPTVYAGIRKLCDSALIYLSRTDLSPSNLKLVTGDFVYDGNAAKWKKFVYGVLARNHHNLSNKNEYDAAKVIEYVDLAMANGNDDFLVPFDATKTDDANFYGPFRDNLTFFRQSAFIVGLLDGSIIAGSAAAPNRDPRIRHMLSASQDTTNGNGGYRGVKPAEGDLGTLRKRVAVLWGDSTYANPRTTGVFIPNLGKYIFKDKTALPVMTYAEMQFIKAEANYRLGKKPEAFDAYKNGINAHFDFINRTAFPRGGNTVFNGAAIPAAARTAYFASPNVKTEATMTISDIMLQKYIALWGWGHVETWTDLRRFHYIDPDPDAPGQQVYKGFVLPAFETTNNNKPAYRVRPRYNSEYVWNREALQKLGGLNSDYHTYEMWFSKE